MVHHTELQEYGKYPHAKEKMEIMNLFVGKRGVHRMVLSYLYENGATDYYKLEVAIAKSYGIKQKIAGKDLEKLRHMGVVEKGSNLAYLTPMGKEVVGDVLDCLGTWEEIGEWDD